MKKTVLLLLAITVALAWSVQMNEEDTQIQERHREIEQVAETDQFSGQLNTRHSCSIHATGNNVPSLPVILQDRIDQTALPLDKQTFCIGNGTGVHIFLLDTGVNTNHQEFDTNRASFYFDAISGPDENKTSDTDGHGTKVASIAMGKNIGIARGAILHSIRVAEGVPKAEARPDNVISALQKVTDWTKANTDEKCVILFPLTSLSSSILDAGFEKVSRDTSCVVVVPAGNYDGRIIYDYDACNFSPGRTNAVITVGATAKNDRRLNLSTYGPCVDIYAPGQGISAATVTLTGDDSYVNVSGTSFAVAAVAGAAAVILGSYEITLKVNQTMTDAVKDILIETSVNSIIGLPSEDAEELPSRNHLLNVENTTIYGLYE